MEDARIAIYSDDAEGFWFTDDVYGGLYKYRNNNKVVEEVLSAQDIYISGITSVMGIVSTVSAVMIISRNLNEGMLIYDKNKRTIESKRFRDNTVLLHGAHVFGNKLFFVPETLTSGLSIIDLETYDEIDFMIMAPYGIEKYESREYRVFGDKLYIPMINESYIECLRVDETAGTELYFIELKDEVKISCADIYAGYIYVLPMYRRQIRKYDLSGSLISIIELPDDNYGNDSDDYVRLVIYENKIYLLPINGPDLLILDILTGDTTRIKCNDGLENSMASWREEFIPYWCYRITDSGIEFLPLTSKGMLISGNKKLETTNYFLPERPDEEWNCIFVDRKIKSNIARGVIYESNKLGISNFVEYIVQQ